MFTGLGSSFLSDPVFAEATNELQEIEEQRASVKENLSEAEKEITAILTELETLNKEIERVNVELIENQKLVDETNNNIDATLDEISSLEEEMKELEKKIEERYEILKNRMVSTQKSGGKISYLEVIFGSQDFGDFISRVSAVNTIANSDAALIEQQEADIDLLEEKQETVFNKLDTLNELKVKQEETKAIISQQSEQNKQRKTALETTKQKFVTLANELQLEDSELASLQEDVKQSIAAEQEKERAEQERAEQEQIKVEQAAKTQVASAEQTSKQTSDQTTNKKAVANEPVKKDKQEKPAAKPANQEKKEEAPSNDKSFSVTSTAYTVASAGGSGVTATGINLKNNPNAKVIAVDPSVIPLGSLVYIEGYGHYIAGDTGGAIKGKKIDVFVPTHEEASRWGIRTVNVTIVK